MNAWTLLAGEPWVQRLGWVLVHFLWQGAGIGLFLALGLWLLGSASAQARYLLIGGALLACGLAPLVTWTVLAQSPGTLSATAPRFASERATAGASADSTAPVDVPAAGQMVKVTETTMASWQENGARAAGLFLPGAVALWLTGVLFLTLRLMFGWLDMQRLCRSGVANCDAAWLERFGQLAKRMRVSVPVRLMESALVEVPTLIGWIRPVILVPATAFAGLAPDQLEAILAHELAHVRRYDYLVNLLQTAIEIALFYHPAVWWIGRKLREERENCCDDMALEVMTDRLVYVSALAQLEQVRSMPLALSASGGPLLQRIRRLVRAEDRKASAWPLLVLMAGFFMACLIVVRAQVPSENVPARSNVLAPGNSPGERSYASSESAALFVAMRRIHLPAFKVTGTPLPDFVREFQALLRDSDPKKEGIELSLSLPEGEPPAAISLTCEPDTSVLNILGQLDNNYHIRSQFRDNRIELRQDSQAEIAFGRGAAASISVHFNQVAVADALRTIQALAAAKGFAFTLEGLDALKTTVPITFQDDSVSVAQAVQSVCYLGELSAAPLRSFTGFKIALSPNEATGLMITGDAINMKRKVLQNDKDGVRFAVEPEANCTIEYFNSSPGKGGMNAYTTGDDISHRASPRLLLTYTYKILDKTSLQFNGAVELKDRQGNTIDKVTGQWTQRLGTRVRLVVHGQPTVRLPQLKEIPPVGAEIDDGYYFYVTAQSVKFPGGEPLMPTMAGNKFIDMELAASGKNEGAGLDKSPVEAAAGTPPQAMPLVSSADGKKMSLGHAGTVRGPYGQGVTVNVSPPPQDVDKGGQVQIGLKVSEIDDDVYLANKDKIDAALRKGGVEIMELLNNMKGVSLLSAPSVTTMPGLKANIDIVSEVPYPISFDPAETVKGTYPARVIPATPREFLHRDVGVSAEIKPTVIDGKIDLYCALHITEFDGFTETNQAVKSPAFDTREVNLLEEFDKGTELKGAMIPGSHFEEETMTDHDNAGKVVATTPKTVKKRLVVFLSASLVAPDGSVSTSPSH